MAWVYRYTDLSDNIIKYVGIVWGKNRTLKQRLIEHKKYDDWCKSKNFKIEYIEQDIDNRTDAEYFEAHYISLYNTDHYYNIKKAGWGISKYLPNREDDWTEFSFDLTDYKDEYISKLEDKIEEQSKTISILETENISLKRNIDEVSTKYLEHERDKLEYQHKFTELKLLDKKISDEENLLMHLQSNYFLINSDKKSEKIYTSIISIIDRTIFHEYKCNNINLARCLIDARNRIVKNFLGSAFVSEQYQLSEEDIRDKINKHNAIAVEITTYLDGKYVSKITYDSLTKASTESGISCHYIKKGLNNKIICEVECRNEFESNPSLHYYFNDFWDYNDKNLEMCLMRYNYHRVFLIRNLDTKNIYNLTYKED